MINPKVQKQPKLNNVHAAKTSPASKSATPKISVTRDRIRDRAFQIYESRGSEPGHATQDWLGAEIELAERQLVSR